MTIVGDLSREHVQDILSIVRSNDAFDPGRLITGIYLQTNGDIEVFTLPAPDDVGTRWAMIFVCRECADGYDVTRIGYC